MPQDRRISSALPRPGLLGRLGALWRPRQRLLPLHRLGAGKRPRVEAEIRALASAVPLGDALLCRALGRYKLLLAAEDRSVAPHLALDGYWKFWITAFLARNLQPGQRLLEAGAGYGYFTVLAADLLGAEGRVVALEPNPRLAALLRHTVALNGFAGRVRVERLAVAEPAAPGFRPFAVAVEDPLAGHLVEDATAGPGCARVPTCSLDSFAADRPDWLWLDLNGGEDAAWSGMQGLLSACPALRLLVEFDPVRCRTPAPLLEALEQRFTLRRIEADGEARPCAAPGLLAGGAATLFLAPR
jgi:FkbM family methyltransferase